VSEKKLAGRVALITGASRGLGRAIAIALAAEGARLALVARDLEKLNEAAAAVRDAGGEAEVFRVDVSDEAQVLRLETDVIARFGGLHILINNAGVNLRKPITDFTLEEWRRIIDTNLVAAFLMCRAFIPHMRRSGYGRIINLTSTMSHVALAGRTPYCASKSGLLGFTKALALELAPDGITVNGISPGPFATEMNAVLIQDEEVNRQFMAKVPLGRWGKVEEVGRLAVWLCAEEAGFVTGTDVLIDGGWCAQ
jgi:NAD(P)-dependent dehydrogenase (short-subunit alcohol dehydrogenase family)